VHPAPPPGADVDYLYDSAIRADLLADLVEEWVQRGSSWNPIEQDLSSGKTYYVIHPVLKHIALNRIHAPVEGNSPPGPTI